MEGKENLDSLILLRDGAASFDPPTGSAARLIHDPIFLSPVSLLALHPYGLSFPQPDGSFCSKKIAVFLCLKVQKIVECKN